MPERKETVAGSMVVVIEYEGPKGGPTDEVCPKCSLPPVPQSWAARGYIALLSSDEDHCGDKGKPADTAFTGIGECSLLETWFHLIDNRCVLGAQHCELTRCNATVWLLLCRECIVISV